MLVRFPLEVQLPNGPLGKHSTLKADTFDMQQEEAIAFAGMKLQEVILNHVLKNDRRIPLYFADGDPIKARREQQEGINSYNWANSHRWITNALHYNFPKATYAAIFTIKEKDNKKYTGIDNSQLLICNIVGLQEPYSAAILIPYTPKTLDKPLRLMTPYAITGDTPHARWQLMTTLYEGAKTSPAYPKIWGRTPEDAFLNQVAKLTDKTVDTESLNLF